MQEQEITLQQILLIFRRRYPYLAAVFLSILALGGVYSSRQTPVYRAANLIIIEPTDQAPVDFASVDPGRPNEFLETQKQIITSRKVISRAADKLDGIEFAELSKIVSVESLKKTNLMEIQAISKDPAKAALCANTLADEYIQYSLEDRRASSGNAFDWLSKQVKVLKDKVTQSEREVLKYTQEEELSSLERRQTSIDDRVSELSNMYSQIVMQRLEKESVLRETQKLEGNFRDFDSIPGLLENEQTRFLKQRYREIELESAQVAKKLKSNHPEVIRLNAQRFLISEKISAETKKIVDDLQIETRIIQDREENVSKALRELKKEAMHLAEQAIQYGVLKREAESNRQLYDVLLERLKETDISSSIVVNNIRVIDKAEVPKKPYHPNIPRTLLLAGIFGLMLGTGVCFLIEYVDKTFKDKDAVTFQLALPIIGSVPYSRKSKKRKKFAPDGKPDEVIAKGYRESKAMLDFYRKEGVLNTLLVTSSVQGEGKTSAAAGLATAFAHAGNRVLLVDADLTSSGLSRFFSAEHESGLSDFLVKHEEPAGLVRETEADNLYLMPGGLIPSDPAELLGSGRMNEFVHMMKKHFDLVIIDSPPVSETLGVSLLGNFVDGTVFMLKAKSTSSTIAGNAVDTLRQLKVNILGVIFNGVR